MKTQELHSCPVGKANWWDLWNDTYEAQVLSFQANSQYGIDEGRISKLEIRDKQTHRILANYDRGWDIEPAPEVMDFYKAIIARFN